MGDVKRSAVPNSATGQKTSSTLPSELQILSSALGARIRVTTNAPVSKTIEGTLFTADSTLHVIAINTSSSSSQTASSGDFEIVPFSHIKNVQLISLAGKQKAYVNGNGSTNATETAQSDTSGLPAFGPVNTTAAEQRLEARVRELQMRKAKLGVNVSAEAQALFDFMDRLYPTTWQEQNIAVANSVVIMPPYTAQSTRAVPGKENTLQRFQMMVDGERKKMAQKATPSGAGAELAKGG